MRRIDEEDYHLNIINTGHGHISWFGAPLSFRSSSGELGKQLLKDAVIVRDSILINILTTCGYYTSVQFGQNILVIVGKICSSCRSVIVSDHADLYIVTALAKPASLPAL